MKCSNCKIFKTCRAIRAASRARFRWSFHNLIAHPLSEIAWIIGLENLSNWIHEKSIPEYEQGQGRG
mgnify:CR=1 FL=1